MAQRGRPGGEPLVLPQRQYSCALRVSDAARAGAGQLAAPPPAAIRGERPRRAPAQSMLMNTGSIIRYENGEPVPQGSLPQFTSWLHLDVAENLAAAFDLDLAVADRPRDPAGRLDQEPVADDQITFEAAAYLGLVDRCRALEQAALGNLDSAAVGQLGVDTAFDEQFVAGIDFA